MSQELCQRKTMSGGTEDIITKVTALLDLIQHKTWIKTVVVQKILHIPIGKSFGTILYSREYQKLCFLISDNYHN